jgi:hypothetical protein
MAAGLGRGRLPGFEKFVENARKCSTAIDYLRVQPVEMKESSGTDTHCDAEAQNAGLGLGREDE